jgi:hypothetical protein
MFTAQFRSTNFKQQGLINFMLSTSFTNSFSTFSELPAKFYKNFITSGFLWNTKWLFEKDRANALTWVVTPSVVPSVGVAPYIDLSTQFCQFVSRTFLQVFMSSSSVVWLSKDYSLAAATNRQK